MATDRARLQLDKSIVGWDVTGDCARDDGPWRAVLAVIVSSFTRPGFTCFLPDPSDGWVVCEANCRPAEQDPPPLGGVLSFRCKCQLAKEQRPPSTTACGTLASLPSCWLVAGRW